LIQLESGQGEKGRGIKNPSSEVGRKEPWRPSHRQGTGNEGRLLLFLTIIAAANSKTGKTVLMVSGKKKYKKDSAALSEQKSR